MTVGARSFYDYAVEFLWSLVGCACISAHFAILQKICDGQFWKRLIHLLPECPFQTLDAFLKCFNHIKKKRKPLSGCSDCQKIRQCGKFCLRPRLRYNVLPSDLQCWEAWLKNMSHQGHRKGIKWDTCDRFLVRSLILDFTEHDYRKNVKLRLLLPSAVPAVLPHYLQYMLNENGQAERKRPRISCSDYRGAGETGREYGGLDESFVASESLELSDCDVEQMLTAQASASCESVGFVEQVFQVMVDCVLIINEAKNGDTDRWLTAKAARRKAASRNWKARMKIAESCPEDTKPMNLFRPSYTY